MMNSQKYTRQFFKAPDTGHRWADKTYIDHAPVWCSVDLRDGNQALVVPMDMETKLKFFQLLVKIGFKEIEVGFPAASETEYDFLRALIERNMIPDDVTVQVLTQAREHIIRKTFEALKGCKNAIVHVYNSTSKAQRDQVFRKSKEEIKQIAVEGAKLLQNLTDEAGEKYRFEYSPESFTGTEPEYALEVCNAVLDVWKPTPDRKAIINLPSTVQLSVPSVYADQVEYISDNLKYRENVVLSLHPHNDRGTGVADAELGELAGADRIEGTIFGNGERTGNVDIVTLALNMYSQGVDPKLHLDDMPDIVDKYQDYTGMTVNPRTPYGGSLVFAAFSGSHQDAISKGMHYRKEQNTDLWTVPYLPIDPTDISRSYDADVIRINSQSGRGGIGFILEHDFGLRLPKALASAIRDEVKLESEHQHKELTPNEIFDLFIDRFEDVRKPYGISHVTFRQHNGIIATITTQFGNRSAEITASGNGRLNAVSNALKKAYGLEYDLDTYEEHALEKSSSSRAIAYVGVRSRKSGVLYWGAGVDVDIIRASVSALLTAVNNMVNAEDTALSE
ncbi:2-isopropylmalate synthase [Porcincola intestinalis]|nr:2-isopropylmalate synthase [Porcincola intestinalis]MCI6238407.1 2-isopropylmalate synthase [Lachnospiraceae bacterium]MCI6699215.1 2-isopropylmalate synthase [Lachnospiraceae bacterium]MCI7093276.1 2-isopropylmalate synthase [Lachnospiraceae bacterium]MDY5579154.1 2-isopropylmalate synthase [Porcincola intestinalis]